MFDYPSLFNAQCSIVVWLEKNRDGVSGSTPLMFPALKNQSPSSAALKKAIVPPVQDDPICTGLICGECGVVSLSTEAHCVLCAAELPAESSSFLQPRRFCTAQHGSRSDQISGSIK
jgi:hypothetical protein